MEFSQLDIASSWSKNGFFYLMDSLYFFLCAVSSIDLV